MHQSQHDPSKSSSVRSKNGPSPSLALSGARHGGERKPKPPGIIPASAGRFGLGLHRPHSAHRVSKAESRFSKAPMLHFPQVPITGASASLGSTVTTRCEELFMNYTISEDISGSVPEQQVGSRLVALEGRSELLRWKQGIKEDQKRRKEVLRRFQTVEDETGGLEKKRHTDPSGNPPSPHSTKEWMAMAAQEMESRPINKRKRPDVRKKNTRFEIPPERSLLNIDQLIAQSTNEEEIKELKQQKRLLRNRQAALDSRQRKEKITEELEKEKKLWTERIFQRKDDLQSMRPQVEAAMHGKEHWHRQQLEAKQPIEIQQWQKEEIVRFHALATDEIRKEISILTDRLRS